MYSLNKVQIIGNVTRDPEVRQIPNGSMVCTVGVATNRTWKDATGNKQEQVEFHNVVCWAKLAEITGQYVKKGNKVYFEGRLQTRNWQDDAGAKHYRTEVVAENLIMLTPKGGASSPEFSGGISERMQSPSPSEVPMPEMAGEKISVNDLPF